MKGEEYFILPPGFNEPGINSKNGPYYLTRLLNKLNGKTICMMKYYLPNNDIKEAIINADYNWLKLIGPNEIEEGCWHLKGDNNIILTAPHAAGPESDRGIGELVYNLHKKTNADAVLSTISRLIIDYNHFLPNGEEFHNTIDKLIDNGASTLIDMHSMYPKETMYDIEIGTVFNETATPEVTDYIKLELEKTGYRIAVNEQWWGGAIVNYYKDRGINCIQIEVNYNLVNNEKVIDALTEIIQHIDRGTQIQNRVLTKY